MKYEALGYDWIHTGVPDFILLRDGEISFVEVKEHPDRLSKIQKESFDKLKKHGFDVHIEKIPGSRKKRKKREKPKQVWKGSLRDLALDP